MHRIVCTDVRSTFSWLAPEKNISLVDRFKMISYTNKGDALTDCQKKNGVVKN